MAESDLTSPSGCTECFRLQVARWLLGLPLPNLTGVCNHGGNGVLPRAKRTVVFDL